VSSKFEHQYLPFEEQQALFKALRSYIEIQHSIEWEKIKLAHLPDFNIEDGFRLFDTDGKGFALTDEVRRLLLELGMKVDRNQLYLFIWRYNNLKDGWLRYPDFCSAFTPLDQNAAELLIAR